MMNFAPAICFGLVQLLLTTTVSGDDADDGLVRIKREDKVIVTTIQSTPYFMAKEGAAQEGYIVDLMQKLKEKTKLNFQLVPVVDGKFGRLDHVGGTWDGMVGEIVEGKASIAAAPLTVTEQRKAVLDFTAPFMAVTLSLVLLKPKEGQAKIQSVKDLTDQASMKCGVLKGGSTHTFFNSTQDQLLQKVNQMINSDPNNLVASYEEGINKVRSEGGNFGMIMESVTAEYFSGKSPCDLTVVTVNSDARNYALAVKKGSQLKVTLDEALGQLKDGGENSELERLKQKWWKSECTSGSSATGATSPVVMAVVAGAAFVFGLIGGV